LRELEPNNGNDANVSSREIIIFRLHDTIDTAGSPSRKHLALADQTSVRSNTVPPPADHDA
jgi:hypothetical protein